MKKVILLAMMCLMAMAMQAQNFVDLGLPSGTKWKSQNEKGFYTYNEAVSQFGNRLPTKAQCEELKAKCRWSWTGKGYKVTGPNGNSIVLPAAGFHKCNGGVSGAGSSGFYWSFTPHVSDHAWSLFFFSSSVYVDNFDQCHGYSVRLVQK